MLNFHLSDAHDAERLPPSEWVSVWNGGYLVASRELPANAPAEAQSPTVLNLECRLEAYMARLWPQAATNATMAAAVACQVEYVHRARKALEERGLLVCVGSEPEAGSRGGRRRTLYRWQPREDRPSSRSGPVRDACYGAAL
jgi:hypothetical protein